jgi:hypothetical protein
MLHYALASPLRVNGDNFRDGPENGFGSPKNQFSLLGHLGPTSTASYRFRFSEDF